MQRYVILGAARQGKSLARYLCTHGATVTLNDSKPLSAIDTSDLRDLPHLTVVGDGHPLSLLDACDVLCLSGGVPTNLPIVQEAARRGIALSNDAQIFFEHCRASIVAITGSAGKTTTTTLCGEMLKRHFAQSDTRAWVGGNIGNPLIDDVDAIRASDKVVAELSSFQLMQMTRSPHIACITNITPNHLDRHADMAEYVAAKKRILEFQTHDDYAVLNAHDEILRATQTRARTVWFALNEPVVGDGAWLAANGDLRLRLSAPKIDATICRRDELHLMGDHNVLNVLAASALAALAGASVEAIRAVATTFMGVPHRLQLVRELRDVKYYNDSIATAPERLMAALRCFDTPIVLLCGGRDKHLPWGDAIDLMQQTCKRVILFGEMAEMVADQIHKTQPALSHESHVHLHDAVNAAASQAQSGDVVLLSPGGTSFDEFKDFAERGNQFTAWVKQL